MVKEAVLQLCYYTVTVVTATGDQSEAAEKKAGDSYTLESSKAVHSVFRPCVEFLQGRGKKGGCEFLKLRGTYCPVDFRLWSVDNYKYDVTKSDIAYGLLTLKEKGQTHKG